MLWRNESGVQFRETRYSGRRFAVRIEILCICLVLVLALCATPLSSQSGLNNPPGKQEVAKHPLVLERPEGPQSARLDVAKLRQDALDLAQLAQSVPTDVDQAAQGKLLKDLAEKLKHIEKLSKRLRWELAP
jgi:hypothetical protein